MDKGRPAESMSDRLERVYLKLLRILTLVVATICIVGAGLLALDSARRALTPTEVEPEPVAVSPQEAVTPVVAEAARKDAAQAEEGGASSEARNAHAAFLKGPFEAYYQQYRKLAAAYRKPEDPILTKPQLAEHLGYVADDLSEASPVPAADASADVAAPAADAAAARATDSVISGLVRTSRLFQTDAAYREAQTKAITAALQDPRLLAKARAYKTAQKTAQACRTEYEIRTVWDRNSVACPDWYMNPIGCSVRRPTPVERCEPAYPEGVKGPNELFGQLDASYRVAWATKTLDAEAAAAAKETEKLESKAGAPASLALALQIGAAFIVVMFLFLLIAVERHLRRLAERRLGEALP